MKVKDIMDKYSIPDRTKMLKVFVESGIFEKFPNKFPLKITAVIDEIDYRLSRNNTACKYIMYKLGDYFGNQEVNDMTAQKRYEGRRLDMFKTDYWSKPKYFKLANDVILSDLPLSLKEKEALQELCIDEDATVGYVRNLMSVYDFSGGYGLNVFCWGDSGPIVKNIIGDYPHEGTEYQVKLARDIVWARSVNEIQNLFKYKKLICILVDNVLDTISEREKTVLLYRYKSRMTFDEIGPILDVTKSRIMQIEAKALRRLRQPARSDGIEFFTKLEEDLSPDILTAITKYIQFRDCYSSKIIDVIAGNNLGLGSMLIYKNELYKDLMLTSKSPIEFFNELIHVPPKEEDIFEELLEEKEPEPEDNSVYLEDLGLSVRAFNCLRRKLIRTLDDLLDIVSEPEELMSIRNLGRTTMLEIINKLKELGYEDRIPDDYDEFFNK